MKTVSVVIPCHNESGSCERLLTATAAALRNRLDAIEIIAVDDCSTDDSLQILHRLQSEIKGLRVLSHDAQCGQSRALVTGIRAARHEVIVTLDGDGQNDPDDIPLLLDTLWNAPSEHLQMVVGWRSARQDSQWRLLSSKAANAFRAWVLKDNTPDTGCGIKAFYREAFLLLPYFDHMHRFLPCLIIRNGGRVLSVPVRHHPRQKGTSHYGTMDRLFAGVIDMCGVVWLLKRSHHPRVSESRSEHDS